MPKFIEILGIRFIDEPVRACISTVKEGGLLVVPSGPGLATLENDSDYQQAVQKADFALADSGYMVLLLKILKGVNVSRVSGLRFLQELIDNQHFKSHTNSIWVMPRESEVEPAQAFLAPKGLHLSNSNFYIAPQYNRKGPVQDQALLELLESEQPKWVVLNIAGGIQEKLGYSLRKNLSYNPTIICTGAAIAFLSGEQVSIPKWADRLYVGWLFRIFSSPRKYIVRYLNAFPLAIQIFKSNPKRKEI